LSLHKQYWSYEGGLQKIKKPKSKSENDCRDALLSDLKIELEKFAVDAQPEASYADSKRADIRISCNKTDNKFSIPIEIKKDSHRELWRAIREQLIAKYTRDPDTNGFGIYLVFWFGEKDMHSPSKGEKINSPKELEEKLVATLSSEERKKIKVCVIDCSLP
jgi:hypothetical protein